MSEITEEKVSKKVRDLFNKGFGALERGNLDFAIDMFYSCVEIEPRFLKARKYLRMAAVKRAQGRKGSFLGGKMGSLGGMTGMVKAVSLAKAGKFEQALLAAESLLKQDPLNPKYAKVFAEAAVAMDLREAAIMTLEMIREHNPDDDTVMEMLGDLYLELKMTREARACYEKLVELRPNDPPSIKKLKDCMAIHSISKDGWSATADEGGSYQDLIRDKKEAKLLEKQSKAVTSESDANELIADSEEKLRNEPENINYYRALARLYSQNKRFDDAVDILERALKMSPGDPELDQYLTSTKVQKFDHAINDLAEAGKQEEAQSMALERAQFVFDDLQSRVERYPNDLSLKFELGVMLFDNDYVNEAIQQFQQSQRSPNHRIKSLYYMARCFRQKKQYDLALMQLESAAKELPTMDSVKKDICYELGVISEEMGKPEKAMEYYKQIYQVDIGFRDVAGKVEKLYGGN